MVFIVKILLAISLDENSGHVKMLFILNFKHLLYCLALSIHLNVHLSLNEQPKEYMEGLFVAIF